MDQEVYQDWKKSRLILPSGKAERVAMVESTFDWDDVGE